MDPARNLRLLFDPSEILRAQGMTPDPWQTQFLVCESPVIQLLCCRGAGKSRTTSAKALHHALTRKGALVLLVSRSQRQALELFRYVKQGYRAVGSPVNAVKWTETQLELANGSRVVCIPGKEETVRGYQGVTLLIKDEAARIPDDMNKSVVPMIAVSKGQEVDLTTPWGQRGWFWRKWHDTERTDIRRFKVTWRECPRHTKEFIDREIREQGQSWVNQEYEVLFTALSGLVFPELSPGAWDTFPVAIGGARWIGGIDFGYRNPFAAIWGTLDGQGNLEITNERYVRECALHIHMANLPRNVEWFADPNHPTEINEMRRAGFVVKKGNNNIAAGIAAIRARAETKRLQIFRHGCPNLIAESELYRYPTEQEAAMGEKKEIPRDDNNHALSALRYLISRLDSGFIAQWLRKTGQNGQDNRPDLDPTIERDEVLALLTGRSFDTAPPDEETTDDRRRRLFAEPDAWTSNN